MSVVLKTIEELSGLLSMETAPGKGTKFTITLPLTLVILDAFLVTFGDYRLAMPQSGVREIIAIEKPELKQLENNRLLPYRGGALPVFAVSDLLRFNDGQSSGPRVPRNRMHVLVIGTEKKAVGLMVDKVTGQREIVVRSISDPELHIPGIIGATELGDGKPILIVDAETLVKLATHQKEAQA
jgi:two-component system, chemotaxis family, sensor kinase CheA